VASRNFLHVSSANILDTRVVLTGSYVEDEIHMISLFFVHQNSHQRRKQNIQNGHPKNTWISFSKLES